MREYSDKKSPKVFTQRQLFACLVLKTYLKATYHGVVEQLVAACGTLPTALEGPMQVAAPRDLATPPDGR